MSCAHGEVTERGRTHLEQVESHVPLATIANGVRSEVNDESVIEREVDILNGVLEVVVRLIQLEAESSW